MFTRFDLDSLYDDIEWSRQHNGPLSTFRKAYAELEAQLEQEEEIEKRVNAILVSLGEATRHRTAYDEYLAKHDEAEHGH